MPTKSSNEESETSQEVVVLHGRAQAGLHWVENTSRSRMLREPIDEEDDNQEQRREERDEGWDGEKMEREQGGGCYDEETDNLPPVRGKVSQEGLERVSEQDDPGDGKRE